MTPSRVAQEKPTSPDYPILVDGYGRQFVKVPVEDFVKLEVEREAAAATPSLDPSIVARIFEDNVGDRLYFWGAGYGTGPDETVDKLATDFVAEYARLDEGSATPDPEGATE